MSMDRFESEARAVASAIVSAVRENEEGAWDMERRIAEALEYELRNAATLREACDELREANDRWAARCKAVMREGEIAAKQHCRDHGCELCAYELERAELEGQRG